MDRLNQLRGEAGGSRDSTLDTSSPPSEAFMTANESSSKYFSLSEVDSTFDISPIKDVSLASANMDSEKPLSETDQLMSNLSPIGAKGDFLDTYKIGKQIEAANILSGGVAIFDDNDNSYDGDELVIDEVEDKSNPDMKLELDDNMSEAAVEPEAVGSKDTEVILQIDGNNVDAIDIGNGLYLYRKEGQEELAAVQIIDDDQQQPNFKFLKVRENAEGNLEVYEEIQIEVPKEVPVKEEKVVDKNISHAPIMDINKIISESTSNKIADKKIKPQSVVKPPVAVIKEPESEHKKEIQPESKLDGNGTKKMKFCESRKSPVIGSFTPMAFHSTPNKEPIPLTKTMVDQQLHPNRHSDNNKKTIEVHTDITKQKILESPVKQIKDIDDEQIQQPPLKKILAEDKNKLLQPEQDYKEVINEITTETEKDEQKTKEEKIDKNNEIDDKAKELSITNNLDILKLPQAKTESESPNVKEDNRAIKSLIKNTVEVKKTKEEPSSKNPDLEVSPDKNIIEIKDSQKTVGERTDLKDANVFQVVPELKTSNVSRDQKSIEKPGIDEPILNHQETKSDAPKDDKEEQMLQSKEENGNKTTVANSKLQQDAEILNKSAASIQSLCNETIESVTDTLISKLPESSDKDNTNKTSFNDNLAQEVSTDLSDSSDNKSKASMITTAVEDNTQKIKSNIIDSDTSKKEKKSIVLADIEPAKGQGKDQEDKKNTEKDPIIETSAEFINPNEEEKSAAIKTLVEISKPNSGTKVDPSCESNKPIKAHEIKKTGEINKLDENTSNPVVIRPVQDLESKLTNKHQEKKATYNEPKLDANLRVNSMHKVLNVKDIMSTQAVNENKLSIVPETPAKSVNMVKTTVTSDNIVPSKIMPQVPICVAKGVEVSKMKKLDIKPVTVHIAQHTKTDNTDSKVLPKMTVNPDQKPINNNHAPVPFGKWTDVNRQAFLNKIKESKVPTNSSNGKQIKNSNDLNRRDVLKKIDSQRQSSIATAKALELANVNKLSVKNETVFVCKSSVQKDSKTVIKTEVPILKNTNPVPSKKVAKQEIATKPQTITTNTGTSAVKKETSQKKESTQRKEINNQDLIDKTIEGIINRAVPVKAPHEEASQNAAKDAQNAPKSDKSQPLTQASLDEIEMKMNELHGIPFIERPPHELPYVPKPTPKATTKPEIQKPSTKPSKIPNLLPFVTKNIQKGVKENVIDVDSEEEIIEHEPITGDMDLTKKTLTKHVAEKGPIIETLTLISADSSKKETIITENDFDKFVRRNSISYENCLTVNYDGTEPLHNLVQTIVQKDTGLTIYAKAEGVQSISKLESPRKLEHFSQNSVSINPDRNVTKYEASNNEDDGNKNYQSKVKMAYQTAMTAKRQLERPITIIEDKPVKVVFTDSNMELISSQLNVESKPSPTKKSVIDIVTTQTSDSLDSDTLDSIDETKIPDDVKLKTKHQRKQVLTPVETPELELIEPDDLGIEVSPKKKRRTEEKDEKNSKTLVPKKSYLLGRGHTADEYSSNPFDLSKTQSPSQENAVVSHKNAASAIDSLVKAAELLETQSGNITAKSSDVSISDSHLNTPVKRGRGRPRKNPLPEGETDKSKVPSPQKKPRLIDAKVVKNKETDDEDDHDDDYDDDDDSIDSAMVKENWTMGKINENIVCPICNKLFRSENVVFKHVKHCTGPSPSRSDSENKSPRRFRDSQGSETKSYESKSDMDIDEADTESLRKNGRKKRKSKETHSKEISGDKDEIIVIEDTPIKPKIDKRDESKVPDSRKTVTTTAKNKVLERTSSLVCEFCGKTFRQLSYLVNHKLQHGKEDTKKDEEESTKATKTIFGCEICKKEFRKLHHLVQHRIIHNPSTTVKVSRKSSSEQSDSKSTKDPNPAKQSDDASAGFRCEPCDKSFRKLHHLVEHRETHDGIINKQKTSAVVPTNSEKQPPPPPQCEVCKKTFRKLHHLIEHKEQHVETSSEKSDDKSIKSSLSTKDIIHECSLCYMVFPNEHSLNKHTVICQRKKRQSATKQIKQTDEDGDKETEVDKESNIEKETLQGEENKTGKEDDVTIVSEEITVDAKLEQQENVKETPQPKPKLHEQKTVEKSLVIEDTIKSVEPKAQVNESLKSDHEGEKSDDEVIADLIKSRSKLEEDLPLKAKKVVDKESKPKIQDTPRKTKTPRKDKVAPTVTKRHRPNLPLPDIDKVKPAESDDDEVRYMLNPDYQLENNEGKLFMKVRASKRNSLQIERPNSKDLVKRRISLQHPPKIPRLKPKPVQVKAPINKAINTKTITKTPKLEPVPSTDSDDSDVKYSFPEPPADKPCKLSPPGSALKEPIKKTQRKSLAEKRKSLSIIAKKKSLGQAVGAKLKAKPSPLKQVRKRTAENEHRCDCGQLFYSAALLARHASLAHTPPRVRRRRSPPPPPPPPPAPAPLPAVAPPPAGAPTVATPPQVRRRRSHLPEIDTTTVTKPAPRKSMAAKTRPSADSRKSSVRSDTSNANPRTTTKRKSSVKTEPKTPTDNRKSPKTSDKTDTVKSASSNVKLRRYPAHKGVPVPEKMRKLMEKSKK